MEEILSQFSNVNLPNFVPWLLTSIAGAGIVKVFDLIHYNYIRSKENKDKRIERIRDYIKIFGNISDAFRFYLRSSTTIVRDNNGKLLTDEQGNFIVEEEILVPENRFKEAFLLLNNISIEDYITQKITLLRLQTSEINDIAKELDKKGNLPKLLSDLYIKTVWNSENILKIKDQKDSDSVVLLHDSLTAANDYRQSVLEYIKAF